MNPLMMFLASKRFRTTRQKERDYPGYPFRKLNDEVVAAAFW
jgi:hypothetical protein